MFKKSKTMMKLQKIASIFFAVFLARAGQETGEGKDINGYEEA